MARVPLPLPLHLAQEPRGRRLAGQKVVLKAEHRPGQAAHNHAPVLGREHERPYVALREPGQRGRGSERLSGGAASRKAAGPSRAGTQASPADAAAGGAAAQLGLEGAARRCGGAAAPGRRGTVVNCRIWPGGAAREAQGAAASAQRFPARQAHHSRAHEAARCIQCAQRGSGKSGARR